MSPPGLFSGAWEAFIFKLTKVVWEFYISLKLNLSQLPKPKSQPTTSSGCAIVFLLIIGFVVYSVFFTKKGPGANEIVHNSELDASVYQVEDYLKKNYLNDPDSYQEISWSTVFKLNESKEAGVPKYQVRHKFRAKNGFGGYVVEEKVFRLDYLGNVVDSKDFLQ